MISLEDKVKSTIRDIPDFPKEGIIFKDITPIMEDHELVKEIVDHLAGIYSNNSVDAIACIEARGFLFGSLIAQKLRVPFIPIRKQGKLPYETHAAEYTLEYGTAIVEVHKDAIKPGWRVLVHDDLLATGGTAAAASKLIEISGGKVAGYNFLVNLSFLNGVENLSSYSADVKALVTY